MSLWHHDGARDRRAGQRPAASTTATIEHRDAIYRALVAELGLSDQHRDHLLNQRGLSVDALALFATLPALRLSDRRELARAVAQRAGVSVAGVPGFYLEHRAWSLVPVDAGFLVPACDARGRLLGFQVRADDVPAGGRRYTMVSSSSWPSGANLGTPAAVWNPDDRGAGVWITEGWLKALIAADRMKVCTIGVAGVLNYKAAVDVLAGAPAGYPVTVAYDALDVENVAEVRHAREALALALTHAGCEVSVASWPPPAKGVDDALLARVPVVVELWTRTLSALRRARPTRPLAVAAAGCAR